MSNLSRICGWADITKRDACLVHLSFHLLPLTLLTTPFFYTVSNLGSDSRKLSGVARAPQAPRSRGGGGGLKGTPGPARKK